uniref:Uncharacterized protein n=1 Tax=uncultured prokaryote TaxID=198431 RepID=A0A0H5QNU1_9ZZZZ|nr:hypothetical protein [uncultured prokaryote]
MNLNEILIDWKTANSPGGVSVLFFAAETTDQIVAQRLALGNFLSSIKSQFNVTTEAAIRREGRILDEETGALVGQWSDTTAQGMGDATGTGVVSNVAQGLIRWNTDQVVNGRFLKGKTYLPGLAAGANTGGEVTAAVITQITAALDTFIATGNGPAVWHRPVNGVGGAARIAVSATLWSEFAIQRGRR